MPGLSGPLPRCGGPKGKVIFNKQQARDWLDDFRREYGAGRGSIYWCSWSGAEPHYHASKGARQRKRKR